METQHVTFLEPPLSCISQKIIVTHCLHTWRNNNVGTLDFANYPVAHCSTEGKKRASLSHSNTFIFTHWQMSQTITPSHGNTLDRSSALSIIHPTICPVPQPLCHHYKERRAGRSGGWWDTERSSGWRGCQVHFSLGAWQSLPGLV